MSQIEYRIRSRRFIKLGDRRLDSLYVLYSDENADQVGVPPGLNLKDVVDIDLLPGESRSFLGYQKFGLIKDERSLSLEWTFENGSGIWVRYSGAPNLAGRYPVKYAILNNYKLAREMGSSAAPQNGKVTTYARTRYYVKKYERFIVPVTVPNKDSNGNIIPIGQPGYGFKTFDVPQGIWQGEYITRLSSDLYPVVIAQSDAAGKLEISFGYGERWDSEVGFFSNPTEWLETIYVLDRAPTFDCPFTTIGGIRHYTAPEIAVKMHKAATVSLPSNILTGYQDAEQISHPQAAFGGMFESLTLESITRGGVTYSPRHPYVHFEDPPGNWVGSGIRVDFVDIIPPSSKFYHQITGMPDDQGFSYHNSNGSVTYTQPLFDSVELPDSSGAYPVSQPVYALLPNIRVGTKDTLGDFLVTIKATNGLGYSYLKIPVKVTKPDPVPLFTVSPTGNPRVKPISDTSVIFRGNDGKLHKEFNGGFGELQNVVYISQTSNSVVTADGVVHGEDAPVYNRLKQIDPDSSIYGKIVCAESGWVITNFGARYRINHTFQYYDGTTALDKPELGNYKQVFLQPVSGRLINPVGLSLGEYTGQIISDWTFWLKVDGSLEWDGLGRHKGDKKNPLQPGSISYDIKKVAWYQQNFSKTYDPPTQAGFTYDSGAFHLFVLLNSGHLWVFNSISKEGKLQPTPVPELQKYLYNDISASPGCFAGLTASKKTLVLWGDGTRGSARTSRLPNEGYLAMSLVRKSQAPRTPPIGSQPGGPFSAFRDLSWIAAVSDSGKVYVGKNSYDPTPTISTNPYVEDTGRMERYSGFDGLEYAAPISRWVRFADGAGVKDWNYNRPIPAQTVSSPPDLQYTLSYRQGRTADGPLLSGPPSQPGLYTVIATYVPFDGPAATDQTVGVMEIRKLKADILITPNSRVTHGVASLESMFSTKVIVLNNLPYDYYFDSLRDDVFSEDGTQLLYDGDSTVLRRFTPPETPTPPGAYRLVVKIKDSVAHYEGTASAIWYIDPNPAIALPPEISAGSTRSLNRNISNTFTVPATNPTARPVSEWRIGKAFESEIEVIPSVEYSSIFSTMRVIGNKTQLGAWQIPNSIQMSRANVPPGFHWTAIINLPDVTNVEFKFVVGTENQWDIPGNNLIENWGENDLPGTFGFLVGDPGSSNNIKLSQVWSQTNPGASLVPGPYRFSFNEVTFAYSVTPGTAALPVQGTFLVKSRGRFTAGGETISVPITAVGPGGSTTVNISIKDTSPKWVDSSGRVGAHLSLRTRQSFTVPEDKPTSLPLQYHQQDSKNIFVTYSKSDADPYMVRRRQTPVPAGQSPLAFQKNSSGGLSGFEVKRSFGANGEKVYSGYWYRNSMITAIRAVAYTDSNLSSPVQEGDISIRLNRFTRKVEITPKRVGFFRIKLYTEKTVYFHKIDFKLQKFLATPFNFSRLPGDLKKNLTAKDWEIPRDLTADKVRGVSGETIAQPASISKQSYVEIMPETEIELLVTPKEDFSIMGNTSSGQVSRGMFIGSDPINIYHGDELIYETKDLTPAAPVITAVEPGDAQLIAYFTAPEEGESAILRYEYSIGSGPWSTTAPAATSSPMIVVGGMVNGTQASFRIRAVNNFGPGAASQPASGTPKIVPSAPTIISVTPSSGQLGVSFSAPTDNGGSAITNYQYSTNNGASWASVSPESTSTYITITGLTNGQSYQVRVRAVNQVGVGSASIEKNMTPQIPFIATAVSAGLSFSAALKNDATIYATGINSRNELNVPAGLSNVVKISTGQSHTLALKNDGTVVAWGWNFFGQTNITGLGSVVDIAAGGAHSLALKNDGTVVGWGRNEFQEITIPSGLNNVSKISAGGAHSLALKNDGTVVGWGSNAYGQITVPAGLSGVTSISAGGSHTMALKADGTVVAWGYNASGQINIPDGLTGVVAIAAGGAHSLALKNDGTVVGWGHPLGAMPSGLTGVVAIAAGMDHCLALKNNGTIVGWGSNSSGELNFPAGTIYYN